MSDGELARLEVLRDLDQRRLTSEAAAQLLGLERRQVFRLLKAYRIDGAPGFRVLARSEQAGTEPSGSMIGRFTFLNVAKARPGPSATLAISESQISAGLGRGAGAILFQIWQTPRLCG